MSVPAFEDQCKEWANPPVDDVGYVSSAELLTWTDDSLRLLIEEMETTRYTGWRNYQNRWVDVLRLETTTEKVVVDYGCGTGIEALQYAKFGNSVILADIAPTNVELALRVLGLFSYEAFDHYVLRESIPRAPIESESLDVIHCSGVLHHIPHAVSVVAEMAYWLKPQGELRLMLYSDVAWHRRTGRKPPKEVEHDPEFERFVRAMDGVGGWADWYDRERLEQRFGEWFEVERCEYLTENRDFIGAVLVKS